MTAGPHRTLSVILSAAKNPHQTDSNPGVRTRSGDGLFDGDPSLRFAPLRMTVQSCDASRQQRS